MRYSSGYVPLNVVLELVNGMCGSCQQQVRQRIATSIRERGLGCGSYVPPQLTQLVKDESERRGVSVEMVRQHNNTPMVVEIRRQIAVEARKSGYSLSQIGMALDRHHTTVLWLLSKKVHRNLLTAPHFVR